MITLLKDFGRYRKWDHLKRDWDSRYREDYKELWDDWVTYIWGIPQWIPNDAIKQSDRLVELFEEPLYMKRTNRHNE